MTQQIINVGGRGWDCNQFLVKDPASNTFDLVDAGHGLDWDAVIANVARIIQPDRVRSVVVTHEHLDHVNGLPKWRQLGAQLVAPRGVASKLAAGHDPTSAQFGFDIPRLDVDHIVGDGDHVELGGKPHQVLETPGHSPGSACYWEPHAGTLFAGDTLFAGGGIGRFDFPDGDVQLLYESILRLSKLPVRVLHSGHGPSPGGDEATTSVAASLRYADACRSA